MTFSLKQTSQFKINKLAINSKFGTFDVSALFEELNIFDSILVPCMSGNILIKDSIGLTKRLLFDGSEFIDINISKDTEKEGTNLTKTFRIFKQTNRTNVNQTSEMYILHFVSEEMVYSTQQKISQGYTGEYSTVAESVLLDYLKVPRSKLGIFEKTKGIQNVVVPLLSPIDTMNWLIKRSVSENNLADYVFFENKIGFNFVSLTKLFGIKELFTINFQPKNISDNINEEFLGVTNYNFNTAFDILENTRSGFYSNRFIGFDVMTRTLSEVDLGLKNHYKSTKHLNKSPNAFVSVNREGKDAGLMPFSKVSLYPFQLYRNYQEYVKSNSDDNTKLIDETHTYIPQRKAIFHNLLQRKMNIALPGNFMLSSGFILDVAVNSFSVSENKKAEKDMSISGKYLIVATRHMIKPDKHETFCEIASDSTNNGVAPANSASLSQSKYR